VQLRQLVWREAFERKNQLATSFFAIFIGVGVYFSLVFIFRVW